MQQTVLVAEDSPVEMRIVCEALEKSGYKVITASDGEEALAQVERLHPRVVVLDVVMPKMNGYQVLRKLKTTVATQDIKVLLLTSKNAPSDRFWGLKQGADDYIAKPFADADLTAAVARFF